MMNRVVALRNPFITNPAMIHLISEMPEPAAYGANDFTRVAAIKANVIYKRDTVSVLDILNGRHAEAALHTAKTKYAM